MSTRYGPSARKIWSLAGSGIGNVISGNGDSGNWPTPPIQATQYNARTPVDLRDVNNAAALVVGDHGRHVHVGTPRSGRRDRRGGRLNGPPEGCLGGSVGNSRSPLGPPIALAGVGLLDRLGSFPR